MPTTTITTLDRSPVGIYLPDDQGLIASWIDQGSGITGPLEPTGERTLVYYEGNRIGASNIVTFADRVHHAWGRQTTNAPTTAKAAVRTDTITRVGHYDPIEGVTHIDPEHRAALAAWITVPAAELDAELLAGGARYEIRREIRAELAKHHDPGRRRFIADYARRHGHDDLLS